MSMALANATGLRATPTSEFYPLYVSQTLPRRQAPSRSLFAIPAVPAPTVAEVIRRFAPQVLHRLPDRFSGHQQKVLRTLVACRQGPLGSYSYECKQCGCTLVLKTPCHNRHCPECAKSKNIDWLHKILSWSLPIPYLHIVFTLPHTLNELIAANPDLLRLLFRSVNKSLRQLTCDRYGVQIGCVMVLHTWGQQMTRHFHLHVLVTAGGLSQDNERWISFLEEESVLTPDKLSPLLCDNYLRGVKQLYAKQQLEIPATLAWIKSEAQLDQYLARSQRYPWRVHVQHAPEHCDGPDAALKYLAQYASGTAIQDLRIVSVTDTHVTIQYKDYRRDREVRHLTLSAARFIERFSHHILPRGLTRVRYTGIFYGRYRKAKIAACLAALKRQCPGRSEAPPTTDIPGYGEYLGPSCPCCGAEGMQFRARYNPELAYDVLQYKEHFRQRITSLYDTLSLPSAATMPLSGLLADDNPITTIAWYAVLTDEVLVGYMLPEPES